MSPVEYNKNPCRPVDFKGQGSPDNQEQLGLPSLSEIRSKQPKVGLFTDMVVNSRVLILLGWF